MGHIKTAAVIQVGNKEFLKSKILVKILKKCKIKTEWYYYEEDTNISQEIKDLSPFYDWVFAGKHKKRKSLFEMKNTRHLK